MRAGCSNGDRKEHNRAHTACRLDATPYGQERHTVEGQSATIQRGHTGHVTGTRTGACAGGRSSERAGTLAQRAERGPRKGHTGLDKNNCRGLDEALRGSGIVPTRYAGAERLSTPKGELVMAMPPPRGKNDHVAKRCINNILQKNPTNNEIASLYHKKVKIRGKHLEEHQESDKQPQRGGGLVRGR
ncbi:hypothetical protein V6N12_045759 [Hibiscus sabdariffa]|uniref:Uncharacterized protein n=1 Tax=Hibiscus sabdariffa TaxID=183260 RepID=A0ABR2G3N2_9ROSI